MRILFVVSEFPALSESFILNRITGLIDRGHSVAIFAGFARPDPTVHGDVYEYSLLNRTIYVSVPQTKFLRMIMAAQLLLKNPWKFRALSKLLLSNQSSNRELFYSAAALSRSHNRCYDIIQCEFGWNGLRGVQLKELGFLEGKLVTSFHGSDVTNYVRAHGNEVFRSLFTKGDYFLAASDDLRQKLIELGCDDGKITVHPMGIDCDRFFSKERSCARDQPIHILTVARFVEKKGIEYGLRAVANLGQDNLSIKYTIVGGGMLAKELERIVAELGIAEFVKMVGWKNEAQIAKILSTTDIFLAPSVTGSDGDEEGRPQTIKEAMAAAIPVISTTHAGIPELIQDGLTGFLVPERDVDALARRLAQLIENPKLREEMGEAGRKHVQANYDISRLNDTLVGIYQRMLEAPRLSSPTRS